MTQRNYGKPLNLPDSFVIFFSDKIAKIRDYFSSTDQFDLSPTTPPAAFADFKQVSETEVHKIIMNSPTKSCLLDPWPTFLPKDCLIILLPSITKLVNCSLSEGVVPKGFRNAIVTPLLKRLPYLEII